MTAQSPKRGYRTRLIICLGLLLGITLATIETSARPASAQGSASISTQDYATDDLGATIDVVFTVTPGSAPIAALGWTLDYDPNIIKPLTVTDPNEGAVGQPACEPLSTRVLAVCGPLSPTNQLEIGFVVSGGTFTTDTAVVSIPMVVQGMAGTSPLTITVVAAVDGGSVAIDVDARSASFTVEGAIATSTPMPEPGSTATPTPEPDSTGTDTPTATPVPDSTGTDTPTATPVPDSTGTDTPTATPVPDVTTSPDTETPAPTVDPDTADAPTSTPVPGSTTAPDTSTAPDAEAPLATVDPDTAGAPATTPGPEPATSPDTETATTPPLTPIPNGSRDSKTDPAADPATNPDETTIAVDPAATPERVPTSGADRDPSIATPTLLIASLAMLGLGGLLMVGARRNNARG